jgi:5-methylcytosine-specific restriction protein B
VSVEGSFDETTFELMSLLHANPTASLYLSHKDAFKAHVERPLQGLFRAVTARLPPSMVSRLETNRNVFARIMKNDFGRGGAWDYYWGALYPRGGRRITGAQLFLSVGYDGMRAGFFIGQGSDQRERCTRNCRREGAELADLLRGLPAKGSLAFGERGTTEQAWREWLQDPEAADFTVMTVWPPEQVLRTDAVTLSADAARIHQQLFPLVLLALEDGPTAAIRGWVY